MTKYSKMNEKIERITKQFCVFVLITHIINLMLFLFLQTVINYYINDLGDESFSLEYFAKWPFNWKTPIGYSVAFTIEFATDMCTQTWFVPTLGFFFGVCRLSITFAKDIASDLNFLNVGGTSTQRQAKLIERFCKIVELYGDARQLRQSISVDFLVTL